MMYGEDGIQKPGIILFTRIDIKPRIDIIWVTKELDILTGKVEILPSDLSDHNSILWQMNGGIYGRRRWRLNEDILDNSEIVENLKKDINDYFDLNLSPNMKLSTIWGAFKAVLRGRLIKWNITGGGGEKKRKTSPTAKRTSRNRATTKEETGGGGGLEKQLKIIKQQP